MATWLKSANFNGVNGSKFSIQLSYDILEQSKANNSSTIRYYLYVQSVDNYSASGSMAYSYINGLEVWAFDSIARNDYKFIGQKDEIIYHNEDGTQIAYYSASANTPWDLGSASLSGSFNLPKIDRYPQIITAPDFTDEEDPTITYTTISGFEGATYQACISLDGTTDNINYRSVNLVDGAYTFELTTTERNILRNATPNSNTLSVTFIIKTTVTENNETTNYYSKVQKQMTIVNANPTFTHSESETNSKVVALLGSGATTVIQNASILQVSISPTALKGASISSVKATSGDFSETKTTSPYTFTIPMKQQNISIVVTDSRNNTYYGVITKTIIEYAPVKLNVYKFERENPTSSNIIVNLEGVYTQTTFGSTANVPTIKWKLNDGSYATIPSSAYVIDTTTNKIKLVDYELTNTLVYTSQGYFSVELSDLLTSSEETEILVLKGIPTFDYGEHDLQVNGDLFVADTNRENAVNVKEKLECLYDITTDGGEVKLPYKIDNKDVYMKRLSTTKYTGTTATLNANISTYTKIWIDVSQSYVVNTNSNISIGLFQYGSSTDWIRAYFYNGNVSVFFGSDWNNITSDIVVTLIYQKT